ncbi:hypothetical protein CYMTET_25695 [Cymbomonas tetramitiformis]|uniref:CG-1 domain-containing protein n=1 Tax=Cymbomonas tetramitiformis TaxID=36881 RepID=A0AAE0KYN8_9CHLO|nr:hypothetical protein CYMTET_25695 [Cymbomonas tetramitiformis]
MAKPSPLPLSIGNLLEEARKRWLKSTEVCEILINYRTYKFRLSEEPPVRPPAGSLFLFDRKHCRFFRKDGHNWRKKKDGKAVRETHEKLKVGAVELLNCYYAHAEHSDSFQRRSYWLLGEKDEGIVLVHYLNVRESHRSRDFPEAREEEQFFRPTQSTAVMSEAAVPSEHTALAHNANLTFVLETQLHGVSCSASSQATSSPAAYPLVYEPRIAPESAAARGPECLGGPSFQPREYPSNASLQAWAHHSSHFPDPTEVKPSIPQDGEVLLQHTVAPLQRPFQEPESAVPASSGRKGCVDALQARLTDLERTFMQGGGSNPFAETMQAEQFKATIQELTDDVNALELAAGLPPPDEAVGSGSTGLVGADWGVPPEQRPDGDAHDDSLLLGVSSDLDMRFTTDLSESGTEAEPDSSTGPSVLPGIAVGEVAPQDCGVIGLQPGLGLDGDLELAIADFAPEWDTELGGVKVLLFCKGMTGDVTDQCVCVFGALRVPVVQLQPGVLRCYAPSHPPGRVPLYLCQREDNQPSSNVCEFWYRAQRQGKAQVGVSLSSEPKQVESDRQFYIRLVTMLTQSNSSGAAEGAAGLHPAHLHSLQAGEAEDGGVRPLQPVTKMSRHPVCNSLRE